MVTRMVGLYHLFNFSFLIFQFHVFSKHVLLHKTLRAASMFTVKNFGISDIISMVIFEIATHKNTHSTG